MIAYDDCIKIGFISKTHGIQGHVVLALQNFPAEEIENMESIFLDLEGGLVPFFLEESKIINPESSVILLRHISTREDALLLVKSGVFVLQNKDVKQYEAFTLIGCALFDQSRKKIGQITQIDHYSQNTVLTVINKHQEFLIPYSGELVISFNKKKKEIQLNLPDNLLEL